MRRAPLAFLVVGAICQATAASAAPRVLVWLPRDAASLQPVVERTFDWPGSLTVLSPENVGQRFTPSPASRVRADDEQRLDDLLKRAESAFVGLRLDESAELLGRCAAAFDRLPPSQRREAAFVRMALLRGRVELARGHSKEADEAVSQAAEAAVEVALDEAEYPPQIRQAFEAAKKQVQAKPARILEIKSEPGEAEVEVNGQLAGRAPAQVRLPPGRCFLSVAKPGSQTHLASCPEGAAVSVKLEKATRDDLRDQLRERLTTDTSWFLEPVLLESLAAEEEARWVVVLDRDRGGGLKALLYSAADRALKTLEPSRLVETELDKLSAAVRAVVASSLRLDAQAVDTPTGIPALEARATDVSLRQATAFVRKPGEPGFQTLPLEQTSPGRFLKALPLSLGSEGSWDVEYYVEIYEADGTVACRAGEAGAVLRFKRTAPPAPAIAPGPAWYQRWYVWTIVGVVAAGAAGTGIYYAVRPEPVNITFGSGK
ncbi:MAG: PEGA domain-containing protein [Myxococcales bacterium]